MKALKIGIPVAALVAVVTAIVIAFKNFNLDDIY